LEAALVIMPARTHQLKRKNHFQSRSLRYKWPQERGRTTLN